MAEKEPGRDKIAPIAFEPLEKSAGGRRWRVRPLALVVAVLILVSLAALWFLFTARAVVVVTDPTDARIDVSGALVVRLADHYLLRPGQYRVTAQAEGYITARRTFTVADTDAPQQVQVRLDKEPGTLAVAGEPAGADILLDGKVVGTAPATLEAVPAGGHTLTLRHPRYFDKKLAVDVIGKGQTQEIRVDLEPAWGTLALTSEPTGAEVTVGERRAGTTPVTVEVLESGQSVRLTLPGYRPWQRQLAVPAGEHRDHDTVVLKPAPGLARVASQPSGATVTVDGRFRGRTPLQLTLSPNEPHKLVFFLDGYQNAVRTLSVEPEEDVALTVDMAAQTGALRLSTDPSGAVVYADGRRLGADGDRVQLPAKRHRLEARKPGYAPAVKTVTPKPGLEQVVRFSLLTEQEARWRNTPKRLTSDAAGTLLLFRPEDTFTMGSSRREQGRRANEVQRLVRLERPFYLATAAVTNARYKKFKATHSSSHAGGTTLDTPTQPVVEVSWLDAVRYCNWASRQDGLTPFYTVKNGRVTAVDSEANGYRLPTEAEWAWAARYDGGTMKQFPWGGSFPPPDKAGNYADQSARSIVGRVIPGYRDGYSVSAPVTAFAANGKALHHLGHNVSEWVHDYYGIEATLGGKAQVDPLGPESGELRVIRGASWRHSSITELRLSFRDYGTDGRDDLGFRLARYVER